MDPGRYGPQQRWDNNSALDGYGDAMSDPNFRVGSSYDRKFLDERFSRDSIYPRNGFRRDVLEREPYPHPSPPVGIWQQTRRRGYEEEYSLERELKRHDKPYVDSSETDKYHEIDSMQGYNRSGYHNIDNYRDHRFDRLARFGGRDRDDYSHDDYDYRCSMSYENREDSREKDYDYTRLGHDSDYDRGCRKVTNWRRRESRERERERKLSREPDQSPRRRYDRSLSRGRDDNLRSRSPRNRSHGRSNREDSYDNDRYERMETQRDPNEKHQHEHYSLVPSATVVVKGLSHKTTDEDLHQILFEWGPLRHIRIIKERSSGISRGFAFIDFPSLGAAHAMMDRIGDDGLVVDGRKLFFEYSSKPAGGAFGYFGQENYVYSTQVNYKPSTVLSDWICIICGCTNFARRTSCFECHESRTDDAPPVDCAPLNSTFLGRKGSETVPTHVLVVRGLGENADEEMIRYEFSKHAPIKDLRLVRDKFTHVSRGFAFVHFHSVEEATKALEATNGTTIEKNGQILRVAYAKNILGPGSGSSGPSQSRSLAAAAIEAATFAQQYDAVGWAPKEYNPDDIQSAVGGVQTVQQDGSAPQSGFVWDEASGYYYDAASGFYYDGNRGLYYDGNNGTWYSYDHQTQQYIPSNDQNDNSLAKQTEPSKAAEGSSSRKVIISAAAATIKSIPDAVQEAASAAIAAEKKEKEKSKEVRLASKSSLLANKKKMSNVLTMWKQRTHEGKAPRVALDDNQVAPDEKLNSTKTPKSKLKSEALSTKGNVTAASVYPSTSLSVAQPVGLAKEIQPRPVSDSLGGTVMGVIRGSGRGVVKSDSLHSGSQCRVSEFSVPVTSSSGPSTNIDVSLTIATPFRTDASALGSYSQQVPSTSGRRKFSELPQQPASAHKEQIQPSYRDRAAERRSLYGSSSSVGDDLFGPGGDSNREMAFKKGSFDNTMPFPPGVSSNVQTYEVITADKAINETNVGNRMLRNMGWHEGSGLGKDGSGMKEPVQAQSIESRAGLGRQMPQKLEPGLEVQAGDSYKTVIQKKALARFREMS